MEIGVKQAAELLKVSEKTVYRWISARRIPFCRVGAQYRFSRSELLRWAMAEHDEAPPASSPDSGEVRPVALGESLRAGGIFYRVDGADVRSLIETIVGMMRLPGKADRVRVAERLFERERMASTGLGDGIAFPHCRDIALPGLAGPLVSLSFLERSVDFGAIDGKPVKVAFTMLSPSPGAGIRLMSRLAYAVRKPSFAELLKAEASRDLLFCAADKIDGELNRP